MCWQTDSSPVKSSVVTSTTLAPRATTSRILETVFSNSAGALPEQQPEYPPRSAKSCRVSAHRQRTPRMNIGNFLQLERSLERGGIVQPAAKEEHARAVCIQRSDTLHIRLAFQGLLDALRQALQLSAQRTLVTDGDQAAHTRDLNRDEVQSGQLCGICLGCRNRNLRAGPRIQHTVCFAGDGGRNHGSRSQS